MEPLRLQCQGLGRLLQPGLYGAPNHRSLTIGRRADGYQADVFAPVHAEPLQIMAKNAPARASAAHVSVIGRITADELLRYVNGTELANGFLNRFTLVAVRRTKLLPDGGDLNSVNWPTLRRRLCDAAENDRHAGSSA
jgi:hypothetical protein